MLLVLIAVVIVSSSFLSCFLLFLLRPDSIIQVLEEDTSLIPVLEVLDGIILVSLIRLHQSVHALGPAIVDGLQPLVKGNWPNRLIQVGIIRLGQWKPLGHPVVDLFEGFDEEQRVVVTKADRATKVPLLLPH